MKFYSEKLHTLYNTEKELKSAEDAKAASEAEQKRKAQELKNNRAKRAKEVTDAFDKANELMTQFIKDYGNFHMTFEENSHLSIFDLLNLF